MTSIETISCKLAKWSCLYDYGAYHEPMSACISESALIFIEEEHKITLPPGYREFLLEVYNGGPGPYGRVYSLEESLSHANYHLSLVPDLLSRPFPLKNKINILMSCTEGADFDEYYARCREDKNYRTRVSQFIAQYRSPRYHQGRLVIGEYGCGIFFFLVITGEERGSVWVEDIANDNGIYPLSKYRNREVRVDFLTWYENWLDAEIKADDGIHTGRRDGFFKYGFVEE